MHLEAESKCDSKLRRVLVVVFVVRFLCLRGFRMEQFSLFAASHRYYLQGNYFSITLRSRAIVQVTTTVCVALTWNVDRGLWLAQ